MWPLAVPVAISIAATLLAAGLSQSAWAASRGLSFSSFMRAAPWTILIGGMAALIALAGRGVRWAVPALIVFVAFDQGFWGYSYVYRWGPIQTIAALVENADAPQDAAPGELIAPLIEGGSGNVAVLRGLRLTPGYTGLVSSSVLEPGDSLSERIAGVAWRQTETAWLRLPGTMPRARLVPVARLSTNVKDDVHGIDIARVALVDRPVPELAAPSADSVSAVRIVEDRPGSIVLETAEARPQLMVLTERFHSGWRAIQDGRERETLRVYGDYLGCLVDAGSHRVTFTFAPASARNGFRLSLVGVAMTMAVTIFLAPWRRPDEPVDARR